MANTVPEQVIARALQNTPQASDGALKFGSLDRLAQALNPSTPALNTPPPPQGGQWGPELPISRANIVPSPGVYTPLSLDSNQDGIPDSWDIQYFGSVTNINHLTTDSDGDGVVNASEYVFGTDPTDRSSRWSPTYQMQNGRFIMTFSTAPGRMYYLEGRASLFDSWSTLQTYEGDGATKQYVFNAEGVLSYFFRVRVEMIPDPIPPNWSYTLAFAPSGYELGSVSRAIWHSTVRAVTGSMARGTTWPDHLRLYSTFNEGSSIYTVNSAFWARDYDFSGVVIRRVSGPNSVNNGIMATAVTPWHLVMAHHYMYAVGDTLYFKASDGEVVVRTVAQVASVSQYDAGVVRLNQALPSTVKTYKFFPNNFYNYFPYNAQGIFPDKNSPTGLRYTWVLMSGLPVVAFSHYRGDAGYPFIPRQGRFVYLRQMGYQYSANYITGGESVIAHNVLTDPPYGSRGIPLVPNVPGVSAYSGIESGIRGGDSGGPIFALLGNEPIYMGCHAYPGMTWFAGDKGTADRIQGLINTIQPSGVSAQQIQYVDLSPYRTYTFVAPVTGPNMPQSLNCMWQWNVKYSPLFNSSAAGACQSNIQIPFALDCKSTAFNTPTGTQCYVRRNEEGIWRTYGADPGYYSWNNNQWYRLNSNGIVIQSGSCSNLTRRGQSVLTDVDALTSIDNDEVTYPDLQVPAITGNPMPI